MLAMHLKVKDGGWGGDEGSRKWQRTDKRWWRGDGGGGDASKKNIF